MSYLVRDEGSAKCSNLTIACNGGLECTEEFTSQSMGLTTTTSKAATV